MPAILLSDFSHVLLLPKDPLYSGGLNALHRKLVTERGKDYDVFEYFELNRTLLDFYGTLRSRYVIGVFTTDTVQDHPQIRPALDKVCHRIIAAADHGLSKRDPVAYTFVAKEFGSAPQTVIYLDDDQDNVAAATAAGMSAIQYRSNEEAIPLLSSLMR
ncbi:MAG: hypothetical protein EPO10_13090 [Reyranella sp.]|uniref:HAD-IA family hydrolase n=1 Tax=Reyranella sp. TaxID=1929291 RepID=UPI00121C9115|nr:HAD-IA family hydrolase [Reyranella sp.]TAJ86851.1 MAG: hypothetical protein EPO41_23930 [Reyranella sp.]TBR28429.1 MAG: hypothetical protein EPO10_13090 [Reyranella sp.]